VTSGTSSGAGLLAERRIFVPLPLLNSEKDLEAWDTQLRSSLTPYNLFRYLDSDVPEPDKEDTIAYGAWEADGADIYRVITISLKSAVWSRITRIGWNLEVVDPRATYRKVFEACDEPGQTIL